MPPDLVVNVLDLDLAPAVPPTLLWLLQALLFLRLRALRELLPALGVLNPLSPGLAVLDARLPLLALALRSLGILLLGARLAGVLTAHLATLHLFHGGHHVRVLGGLVRFEYLPHLFRKAMSDLPKTGTAGGGGRRGSGRGQEDNNGLLSGMLTCIQQHSIRLD